MTFVFLLGLFLTYVRPIGAMTTAFGPGCYEDCVDSPGCEQRLLSHTVTVKWDNMTVDLCSAECRKAGFDFAGVEAAYGCFCGDTNASAIVETVQTECCSPCLGNTSQECGGKFRIWVVATSSTRPLPQPLGCPAKSPTTDPRNILNGTVMLTAGYLDQPYCDILSSGRWICSITLDDAHEGGPGEHIVALWSDDVGKTWSKPVSVEPAPINTALTNAYSMTIVAPKVGADGADRVYVIYNMNVQNITTFPNGGSLGRNDMLGNFVMRFSDDNGATWSSQRYTVPNPVKPIDRGNEWGGNMTIMWTVDQTKTRDGTVYFGFTKIGKYMLGPPEELWVLSSANLLTEKDASMISWTLLPDADHGISLPQDQFEKYNFEEAHVVPMNGVGAPGFYIEGRTTTGYLVASETADGTGKSGWTPSHPAQYYNPSITGAHVPLSNASTPFGGSDAGLKNPRGPTTLKRFDVAGRGRYLLLFYNNHAQSYLSRDPYWLACGVEVPSHAGRPPTILFSQPEIIIYDAVNKDDRPGYPDFIEHVYSDGSASVFITETQKDTSRLHRIPDALLQGLWAQDESNQIPTGAALNISSADQGKTVATPPFPALDGTDSALPAVGGLGFAVGLLVEGVSLGHANTTLFDSTQHARGVRLAVGATNGEVTLTVGDGHTDFSISTDAACSAVLASPGRHFFGAVLDGGPCIATVMVDGVLCDGAGKSDTGWMWFPPLSADLRGGPNMLVAPTFPGKIHRASWWTRMLTTSELVGLYRAFLSSL